MQVVNALVALAVLANSVLAAPGVNVSQRQATPFVTVELWSGKNCDGILLAVNTYVDDPEVTCDVSTLGISGIESIRVLTNTSPQPSKNSDITLLRNIVSNCH